MSATSKFTEGIGERIRYIRKQSSLSQVDLGEKLKVTRQSISGYETERLIPSTRVIENICDQYGVNPWWLLYGVGTPLSESGDVRSSEGLAHLSMGREKLTHAQLTLIEYIKSDQVAAQELAKQLWDKALEL